MVELLHLCASDNMEPRGYKSLPGTHLVTLVHPWNGLGFSSTGSIPSMAQTDREAKK